jgi:hypothetical protein
MKTSSDSFDDVADNEALLGQSSSRKRNAGQSKCTLAIWLLLCTVIGLIVGLLVGYGLLRPSYNQCVSMTTQTSMFKKPSVQGTRLTPSAPLLSSGVEIDYKTIPFNGSFMQKTIYREDASPEVDAAWEALGVNCEYGISFIDSVAHV